MRRLGFQVRNALFFVVVSYSVIDVVVVVVVVVAAAVVVVAAAVVVVVVVVWIDRPRPSGFFDHSLCKLFRGLHTHLDAGGISNEIFL